MINIKICLIVLVFYSLLLMGCNVYMVDKTDIIDLQLHKYNMTQSCNNSQDISIDDLVNYIYNCEEYENICKALFIILSNDFSKLSEVKSFFTETETGTSILLHILGYFTNVEEAIDIFKEYLNKDRNVYHRLIACDNLLSIGYESLLIPVLIDIIENFYNADLSGDFYVNYAKYLLINMRNRSPIIEKLNSFTPKNEIAKYNLADVYLSILNEDNYLDYRRITLYEIMFIPLKQYFYGNFNLLKLKQFDNNYHRLFILSPMRKKEEMDILINKFMSNTHFVDEIIK